jgi:asparagine synthase (glutamine-hydrolysing)
MLPSPVAYWSLIAAVQRNRVRPFKGDYEEAVDQLEQRLLDAVRLQAIADVPVGAFLSGGVDSSIVAALMQRSTDSKVMTFSIGMPDDSIDESHHAALVAKHLGSEHIEHRIQPEEALDTMLLLPKIWDEPFADSSQVPTYLLSRLARKHVTVALSGDGGDELFLGYNHYRRINSVWKSRTFRHFPFRTFLELVNSKVQSDKLNNYYDRAKNVVDAWDMPTKISLARHWSNRYNSRAWPTEECHPELKYFDYSIANNLSPVETVALWDGCQYLPDDILVKVDRAAMAVSLETRAPLLDHRLVEFALSLPVEYRLKGKINKRVLRDVLYRYVPQSLVDRPKQGFTIPIAKWLRNELRESASQHLANLCHLPGFNKKIIKSMWLEHCDGKRDHSDQLWGLIMLGSFYEKL